MTLQQLRYAVCIAKNKSMNKAAAELFISQPSLSVTIRDLEEEIGFPLFQRSSRGIVITAEGEDFLGYARQMIEQYRLMEEKFIEKKMQKQKFSVSMQHYTFAVQAFIKVAKELEMELDKTEFHELMIPYITNVTAEAVTDVRKSPGLLVTQLTSSVRWQQSMEKMIADGVDTFIEIGPGKTLAGFMKKIDRSVKVCNVATWEDLEKII